MCERIKQPEMVWQELTTIDVDDGQHQHNRINELEMAAINRHCIDRKTPARRLQVKDVTLRDYCNGTIRGSMGVALQLALEVLASRPMLY